MTSLEQLHLKTKLANDFANVKNIIELTSNELRAKVQSIVSATDQMKEVAAEHFTQNEVDEVNQLRSSLSGLITDLADELQDIVRDDQED